MGLITEVSKPAQPTPSPTPATPQPVAKPAPAPPILTAPALAHGQQSITIENNYRFSDHAGQSITNIIPCHNVDSYLIHSTRHDDFLKSAIFCGVTVFVVSALQLWASSSLLLRGFAEKSFFLSPMLMIIAAILFMLWLFVRQVSFEIHALSGSNKISMKISSDSIKAAQGLITQIEQLRSRH